MTDIQGYVIVHKETGERLGSCYESVIGAKTSFYSFTRRSAHYHSEYKHLAGKKFNDQAEYVIKPLVIYDAE
ncbi:hypothetical protein D3C86_1092450 [compost metagenome]